MKTRFLLVFILVDLLGLYIGFTTVRNHEMAVRGLMGISNIFLIYLFFPPRVLHDRSLNELEQPYDGFKYLAMCLFFVIIIVWSVD
jgi:hypothetical protein